MSKLESVFSYLHDKGEDITAKSSEGLSLTAFLSAKGGPPNCEMSLRKKLFELGVEKDDVDPLLMLKSRIHHEVIEEAYGDINWNKAFYIPEEIARLYHDFS